jgi:hypothetical protein
VAVLPEVASPLVPEAVAVLVTSRVDVALAIPEVLVVVLVKIEVAVEALVLIPVVILAQECPTVLKEEANVALISQRLPAADFPLIRAMVP